ncbi:ATP/GTP-binding protein [Dactylosporangium fulvum]|uniref:ATP/GTP-binding protein n=1 Tax=Dactylosporangium fulvum TaxID=53359 RepID=A0ABY5WBN4_9ACTN|nr:ATP/GTP-binding protein [Dactylosporangium fulvum]UWP86937.1 ATP/GTP-binding protein [Dactylosporangium fulvum]
MASSSSDNTVQPAAAEEAQSTKIVIAGGFGVGKTTLVASISEIAPVNTDVWMTAASTAVDPLDPGLDKATTTIGMDFGRITLPDGLRLFLFGTPGQPRFWPLWDDMCRGALGALVLVDTLKLEKSFAAVNYFDLESDVPFVVAVNRFHGRLTHSLDEVRAALALHPEVPVTSVDARDRSSVQDALILVLQHAINRLRATDLAMPMSK